MNPLPFSTTNAAFSAAFSAGLDNTLFSILEGIAAPLSAVLVVWIIIQGILVMRGDLDTRRGVNRIIKVVLVYALISGATYYTNYVQNWFIYTVPQWVSSVAGGPQTFLGIPLSLDAVLQLAQQGLERIASQIGTENTTDESSYQTAKTILYGTLFTVFALYEVTTIMTSVLLAIGPLFIVGYLFDATKQITERWIGQLINYAILLLLINIVAVIVVEAEFTYMTLELGLFSALQPLAGQISDFYDLDIFMLTGDFIIVTLPAVAAFISGGINSSRNEVSIGSLHRPGTPKSAQAGTSQSPKFPTSRYS